MQPLEPVQPLVQERLFEQEQEQAIVQMNLNAKNYTEVAEPMSNIYGALYSTLATDENSQRKSMRYIGSCIGRVFYLLDKAVWPMTSGPSGTMCIWSMVSRTPVLHWKMPGGSRWLRQTIWCAPTGCWMSS